MKIKSSALIPVLFGAVLLTSTQMDSITAGRHHRLHHGASAPSVSGSAPSVGGSAPSVGGSVPSVGTGVPAQ